MIDFLEVEQSIKKLKRQYKRGEIDTRTLEESLLGLIDKAEDGYYWMLGHETGRWYRHDGEHWLPHNPGEMFVPLEQILPQDRFKDRWQSFSMGWFMLSLIILALVAGLVFYSAL